MATNNLTPVTLSANGDNEITYDGQGLTIFFSGDFGTGNVVIESSPDGVSYIVENSAKTVNGNWTIGSAVAAGMRIRTTLASSTAPTLIISYFQGKRAYKRG